MGRVRTGFKNRAPMTSAAALLFDVEIADAFIVRRC